MRLNFFTWYVINDWKWMFLTPIPSNGHSEFYWGWLGSSFKYSNRIHFLKFVSDLSNESILLQDGLDIVIEKSTPEFYSDEKPYHSMISDIFTNF